MAKRYDATEVKGLDGYHSILPYVMPKRTEAEVSLTETFDVTELLDYLKKRNEAEGTQLKMFHAFCTAVARTVYHRPQMNYFIAGRKFWQRNDITLSFTAKQKFEDTAEEALMFLKVKPEMNLDEISKIIVGDVKKARDEAGNDLGDLMSFVGKLPRFVLVALFGVLKRLEYHGHMPKSLRAGDPNYSSVMLSNLGSIGSGAPYHHLSNYGTCSIMITIGTMRKVKVTEEDGTEKEHTKLDATFTLDERLADGFYFVKSVRITRFLLEHPTFLAEPIMKTVPVEL